MKIINGLSGYHSKLFIDYNFYGLGIMFKKMAVNCEWVFEIDFIFIRFWILKDETFKN